MDPTTKQAKTKVLYLDDEVNNLQAFKAVFRKDFEVHIAATPQEAHDILDANPIEVIISDQRMPIQTGTEFFHEVVKRHPDPIRILLTGFVDIQAVIDAINKGEVFRFLTKPWNEDEVRISIENAAEMLRTRRELNARTSELELAYEELDQFVYSASHDLRSPITSLKGILEIAARESEPSMDYLDMIRTVVTKMDQYVVNVINYYRSNRTGLHPEEVDIAVLITELLEEFRFHPAAEQVDLQTDLQPGIMLRSDPIKLNMIVRNLVLNAIQFQRKDNPQKKVWISGKAEGDTYCLNVEDNGQGIRQDLGDRLFEMFQRDNLYKAGTGLGLYIVHQSVKKLRGRIEYKSEVGKGATFSVLLPMNLF